jgi:hypothetical protein
MRPTFYLTENKKVMRHKKVGYFKQVRFRPQLDDYLISSQNRLKIGHYCLFTTENRPEMSGNIPLVKTEIRAI